MSDRRDDGRLTDEELDGQGPRRRGRGVLAGLFVLLVLGALYVGTAVYFGDRVPASTTVGGVSIGGMDESEARAALERGTKDAVTQPLQVEGAGTKTRIDPAKAGLTVDYDASLKPVLSKAGLITRDAREVERKKVGLHKARRRKQFSKR